MVYFYGLHSLDSYGRQMSAYTKKALDHACVVSVLR